MKGTRKSQSNAEWSASFFVFFVSFVSFVFQS
jgi:hypothetical protein